MKNLFDIKDKVIVLTGGAGSLGTKIPKYPGRTGAKIVDTARVAETGNVSGAEAN